MKHWTYISFESMAEKTSELIETLNRLGKDGWELVALSEKSLPHKYIMKREVIPVLKEKRES